MSSKIQSQAGESVWHGADMKNRESDWIFHVNDVEIKELEVAVNLILADLDPNVDFLPLNLIDSLDNFNLPNITAKIKTFLEQLDNGLGFFLWRGLPVKKWSHKQSCAAFLLIGRCMGNLRQQNAKGHVLGHVRDAGVRTTDPTVRHYQTNERITFHTDISDIVGLLCLQTSKSGGLSAIVSSSAVFNEILKTDPELANELLQPMPLDKRGEVVSGMKPYWDIPVYHKNQEEGYLSAIYLRMYINSSQRFSDAPRLTEKQIAALDLCDKLINDPQQHFTMELQEGSFSSRKYLSGGYWDQPFSKPYFENSTTREVTTTVGQTAYLHCRVRNLGDRAVSWIRKRDLHILTVGILTYTSDQRFQSLHSDGTDEWTLKVTSPQIRDSGTYECQVSTEPKISTAFHLSVVVSQAEILGNSELHLKSGSDINLTCIVRQTPDPPTYIYWYHGRRVINYSQRGGINVVTEKQTRTSRLLISKAQPSDSGNYTCSPANSESVSILVHVLNGEHPAAMQHGNTDGSCSSYPANYNLHLLLALISQVAILNYFYDRS